MKTPSHVGPLMLLLLPLLGACERPHPATGTTPAASAASAPQGGEDNAAPQTIIGKAVDKAIQQARRELETGNIDLSHGFNIDVGDHGRHVQIGGDGRTDRPKAEITPQGDFLVDGRQVAVTPAQRALLLQYRQQIIAVAEAGMSVGVKGADLAGKAMLETVTGLMHGHADEAGKRIQAEGEKLKVDARRICAQLPGMLQSQQHLATSLPAFKPYATMTQADVDDCMKDHDAAVMSQ